MPSTYTTNAGIELPANGEQSATWGNTVNENMTIIDRLTNGVGSISLSGVTHTLTTSDGAVSDGHYKVLVLGGSPSGTNTVTISPNDAQHIYIIKNNTGQTALFTQGTGTNVSILSNTSKIIYADGAGNGASVVDLTGSLDLGSLIVGGVTVTSTAAELNKLDGFTGDVNDLNYAKDLRATGVTTSEFDVLDGITATTAEINYVDGVTSNVQTQLNTKAPSSSPTLSGPTIGGTITITGGTQSWTVTASGTNLTFAYNNTNVLRVDSSGNLIALGDLTTNGTIS
tara:strand:- start:336 stop:1187 length:852 start_codon:yes stop_codon:yes gene_type:complete